ncbi:polysaccharide ABC transporter ATP-binding protein [Pedobacter frigiditerrae]|uniref:ABC transporter ATP-binding protein n=1 Tax=Pedobacter frigiditerrae TaxID=2530452 RepID=UPI002931804B|nr:polysaccharide ABC transporter ATP-binding protein [Pedobacter frigiditerrae]
MSNIVIKAENVSKMYQIGEFSTGTISQDVERWFANLRGKEDKFLTVGATNDRTTKADSNFVWSLKDIDFEIRQGDAVGVIGRNGAGKSTLLKVLSRVTAPTTGSVKVKGRIASLLEVGTGFHPELTGRENIFLNGAILGMRKHEIKKHFDAIVDFAGIERYIDTPVKRYSSGMYVRLAFAVAAHLESEILIVDEVLAVGDAEFQKKCLGKMNDVSKGQGRTVLFVSHNISSIYALTNSCIFMSQGTLVKMGPTSEVAELYQNSNQINTGSNLTYFNNYPKLDKPIELLTAKIDAQNKVTLDVSLTYVVRRNVGAVVAVKLTNGTGTAIITLRDNDIKPELFSKTLGEYSVKFSIPISLLSPNIYRCTFSFSDMKSERFDFYEDLLSFEIEEDMNSQSVDTREGILRPNANYINNTIKV